MHVCFQIDVDECLGTPCPVNGICHNTLGSFNCSCLPGMSHNKLANLCEGEVDTVALNAHIALYCNVVDSDREHTLSLVC